MSDDLVWLSCGPTSGKAMIFPIVIYGYESWTIKKAEPKRIGAFELRC